jgi:Na+-exporting ATPase
VLFIAQKSSLSGELDPSQIFDRSVADYDLSFVGLVGLYDPRWLETATAVKQCQIADITVHMLTGDHILTATSIAKDVGI